MSATASITAPSAPATTVAPIVAVVGLHGGAGTSTVAALLAYASAGRAALCDVGGPTATLWRRADSGHSLAAAADALARDALQPPLAVQGPGETTVVAGRPQLLPGHDVTEGMRTILGQAATRHALVLVDCGCRSHPAQASALALCDQVVWVADLTVIAIDQITAVLSAGHDGAPARQYIAARGAAGRSHLKDLRRVASESVAPIALLEDVGDGRDLDQASVDAGMGLDALIAEITR